jgi:tetratricopeptide (TPR) repeat protein
MIEENSSAFKLSYGNHISDTSQSVQLKILNVAGLYQTYCFNHNITMSDDFHNQTHRVCFTNAFTPWNRLSCGFNLGTKIDRERKRFNRNLFLDLGVIYKVINNQIIGEHSIGASVQNVLSPSVQQKKWHSQPVNTKLSWWTNILGRRINAGFDFYIEDCMSENPELTYISNLGLNRYPFTINALAGREFAGGSFGYSFTTPGLHEFSLLMQYVRNIRQHDEGQISFTCVANLGAVREELYNRRMARTCCFSQNDIYIKGFELYRKQNYFEALALITAMMYEFPDFFKNDWCSYLIGDCYAKLGMLEVADWKLNNAKYVHSKSAAYPFYISILLRVAVEENVKDEITNNIKLFRETNSQIDSLSQEVDFLVAEHKFKTDEFDSALWEYKKIAAGHPLYVPAQYSMAAIYHCQNNKRISDEILSRIEKGKIQSIQEQIERVCSFSPVSFEELGIIKDRIKKERLKIQCFYDSLSFTIEKFLYSRQSGTTIKIIDSLHTIQQKYFSVIEKDRLIQNSLYKKWQILGHDLLECLNKDELDILEKCQKIIGESK